MQTVVKQFEQKYRKAAIAEVRSGDTVRVSQKIREAGKERTQVFEGMVIRTKRMNSLTASITVRKIASGVGVEKAYQLHSPNVVSVQVVRRGKVRRNFLTYIRERQGKSMRLTEQAFDSEKVNVKEEPKAQEKEASSKETAEQSVEDNLPAGGETEAEKPSKKAEKAEASDEEKTENESSKKKNPPAGGDKAAKKKAKADAFRKAQEAKK